MPTDEPVEGWIKVECPKCHGDGTCAEAEWYKRPNGFKSVVCPWCRGNRILLARPVEFQKVTDMFSQ